MCIFVCGTIKRRAKNTIEKWNVRKWSKSHGFCSCSRQTKVCAKEKKRRRNIPRVQTIFSGKMYEKLSLRYIYVNWNMQFPFPYSWSCRILLIAIETLWSFENKSKDEPIMMISCAFARPSLKLHPEYVQRMSICCYCCLYTSAVTTIVCCPICLLCCGVQSKRSARRRKKNQQTDRR